MISPNLASSSAAQSGTGAFFNIGGGAVRGVLFTVVAVAALIVGVVVWFKWAKPKQKV